MFGDDYLNDLIRSMQDPTREARRQMEEMSGARLAERFARETWDARAAFDRQLVREPHRDAYRALSTHQSETLDKYRDQLRDATSSLSSLSGCRATDIAASLGADAAALSQAYAAPDATASIGPASLKMMDTTAALSDRASQLAYLDADLFSAQTALSSTQALDYMSGELARLKDIATALRPLETLSASIHEQFGSTLTLSALEQALELRTWDNPTLDYQREFQGFMGLASEAMGYSAPNEDAGDVESGDEVSVPRSKNGNVAKVEVYCVALRFTLPAIELGARLRSLASRIDHTAVGATATWDRMILAIAKAYPDYARDITQIAHPLMQRLVWPDASSGSGQNQSVEALSMEDAEQFEELAKAMLKLLKRIEDSIAN